MINVLTEVWTPASVSLSLITGFLIGALVLARFMVDAAFAYGPRGSRHYAVLSTSLAELFVLAFWSGQFILTYLEGDPNWSRVFSRFTLNVLFALASGAAIWLRLQHAARSRRSSIHERAVQEVENHINGSS